MRIFQSILLILFLIQGLEQYSAYAFEYPSLETVVKKTSVIIEGKIISHTKAYRANKGIYTSYIVKVYKVFKGDIQPSYVEIPVEGGTIGDVGMNVDDNDAPALKDGIFFLSYFERGEQFNSGDTLPNHIVLRAYYSSWTYAYSFFTPSVTVNNIEKDMYQRLEQIIGIKRRIISVPDKGSQIMH